MLGEVEVAAERSAVQFQIDRTVYSTANTPVAIGGTATNILETIPSIDVDVDGNISLRGSGNVAVLINGRPAPVSAEYIATYLRQLPAGSIDRVEVIPNPSARYEPDGLGGIINIVLKEETDLGYGGTVILGYRQQYVTARRWTPSKDVWDHFRGPMCLAARPPPGPRQPHPAHWRLTRNRAGFSIIIDQPDLYNEFSREFGAQAIGLTFTSSFGQEQPQNRRRDQRPDDGGDFDQGEMQQNDGVQ